MNHAQKALFEVFSRPPKVGVQQFFSMLYVPQPDHCRLVVQLALCCQ